MAATVADQTHVAQAIAQVRRDGTDQRNSLRPRLRVYGYFANCLRMDFNSCRRFAVVLGYAIFIS